MSPSQIASDGQANIADAAIDYEEVNLSSADYKPATPFRSVYVGEDGDLVLLSPTSGRRVTFKVTAGVWPLAGRGIVRTGTTAGSIVALF